MYRKGRWGITSANYPAAVGAVHASHPNGPALFSAEFRVSFHKIESAGNAWNGLWFTEVNILYALGLGCSFENRSPANQKLMTHRA